MADDPTLPPGPGSPAPFEEPPPSVAAYEAIPLARDPPDPREIHSLYSREVAERAERLLASIARARGAVDIAMGEGLAALDRGDRLAVLCYSSVGDYAREALGIAPRTAQDLVRLARALRERPLLSAAVRAGEIGVARAKAILPVARGGAEAAWVERARCETVRELQEATRGKHAPEDDDEQWRRMRIRVEPEDRVRVDRALAVAGKLLGPTSSRWERLESMAQEYLGSHASNADDPRFLGDGFRPMDQRTQLLEARLEAETERWSALSEPEPYEVPGADASDGTDPRRIDWRLRELNAMRARWDGALGWLALVIKRSRIWRILGFASFRHYCRERLRLGVRTVERRIALEERLWEVPALRQAVQEGLSYEKARLVSQCPDDVIEEAIGKARELTCIALRRWLETENDAQMRARRTLTAPVPSRVAFLLAAAFEAVRAERGARLPAGRCLAVLADEYLATWEPALPRRKTRSMRIRERDGCLCQVPGCSRPAMDAHHQKFRSHGGGDEPENLVSTCLFHHHRCLHERRMTVIGRAPNGLLWLYGARKPGGVKEARAAG